MREEEIVYGRRGVGFVEYARFAGGVAVLAVHGGGIEPGTEELAEYAAAETGCSLYVFSGRLEKGNSRLRRMSRSLFREEDSLRSRVIGQANAVISIHGHGRDANEIYAVGASEVLKGMFVELMAQRLPAFPVVTDPAKIPKGLAGLHPDNVVNLPAGGGLQLELPARLRTCTDAPFGKKAIMGDAFVLGEVLVELIKGCE